MRKSIILFASIAAISLVIVVCLIFKAFVPTAFVHENYQTFYLNTDEMTQADTNIINNNHGSYAHAVYNFRSTSKEGAIGANAFLVVYRTDSVKLNADTVLVLDTGTYKKPELNVGEYYVYITPRKRLNGCMVSTPQKLVHPIKKHKFMYAEVDLVIDD